jgi:hypothetical protein
MPRIRRPLLALIALVLAFVIGYGIRAANSGHDHHGHHGAGGTGTPTPTSSSVTATP